MAFVFELSLVPCFSREFFSMSHDHCSILRTFHCSGSIVAFFFELTCLGGEGVVTNERLALFCEAIVVPMVNAYNLYHKFQGWMFFARQAQRVGFLAGVR